MKRISTQIDLSGCVQGIGFRPQIYRMASKFGIDGFVQNTDLGVKIVICGDQATSYGFIQCLRKTYKNLGMKTSRFEGSQDFKGKFTISASEAQGAKVSAQIPLDRAPCQECLEELKDPQNRRFGDPFVSCTQCGPRYSIVSDLPYDRSKTSMTGFLICEQCRKEYQNPKNRRFHAQTISCKSCGPKLKFQDHRSEFEEDAIDRALACLRKGGLLMMKGIGGYQILADASNASTVSKLRRIKQRASKPFAVMVLNLGKLGNTVTPSPSEKRSLKSPAAPIIILNTCQRSSLLDNVSGDLNTIGVLAPSSPLHHIITEEMNTPLVVTSANWPQQPMIINDDDAITYFQENLDGILYHNRPIVNRCDDSLVREINGQMLNLRLGRGLAPIYWRQNSKESWIASGAHSKHSSSLLNEGRLITLPYHGNLDSEESLEAAQDTLKNMLRIHKFHPTHTIGDPHPQYQSHRLFTSKNKSTVAHHEAHAWACIADNEFSGKALVLAWDGLGLNEDHDIWGGEAFIADTQKRSLKRIASVFPFPLLGGDLACQEPRRVAIALIHEVYGENTSIMMKQTCPDLYRSFAPWQRKLLYQSLGKAPRTSSMGRLFDAVSSLLGICQINEFEGQGAMLLESEANKSQEEGCYRFSIMDDKIIQLDWRPIVKDIMEDLNLGLARQTIARKFHNTLAGYVKDLQDHFKLPVFGTGGVFQNKLLCQLISTSFKDLNIPFFTHKSIPPNDGGLAYGQMIAYLLRRPPCV